MMTRTSKIPGSKKLLRGLDALVGGLTIGEQAKRGDTWKAAGVALTLAIPLLWKKRLGAFALAALAAVLSYYFFDEFHEPEVVTRPIEAPSDPSLN